MKLYKTIYLANPQDSKKWEIVEGLNANFISGDSPFVDKNGVYRSNEDWNELNDDGIPDWNDILTSGTSLAKVTIEDRVMNNIKICDALILYIEDICKNTVILEITYASTIGKPCYIIANNKGIHDVAKPKQNNITYNKEDIIISCEDDEEYGEYIKTIHGKMHENIWVVTGLPNVHLLNTNTSDEAKDTIRKLLLLESPIEALLIQEIADYYENSYYTLSGIEPQFEVAAYRIDFAYPDKKLAIELDGHEYHKTKEQRKHDSKRDRALNMEGWRVIRFTGSEIYQNVYECFDEITDHLRKT